MKAKIGPPQHQRSKNPEMTHLTLGEKGFDVFGKTPKQRTCSDWEWGEIGREDLPVEFNPFAKLVLFPKFI